MQNKFSENFYKSFLQHNLTNKFIYALALCAVLLSFLTISSFLNQGENTLPTSLVSLILVDLIVFLLLLLAMIRKTLFSIFKDYQSSRIRARIILMFSIIAAIPTIIVSVFSVIIFNYGLQSWFDSKVSTAIDQSVRVADLYILEQKMKLKETAFSMADDLNDLYNENYLEMINTNFLTTVLNRQAEVRSLTEAIVFQRKTNTVLAQNATSFSFSFWRIPQHDMDKADSGEVVEIFSDPGKIRMLIRLIDYHESTYLLIGRLVDEEIINYVDKTTGAAQTYNNMKGKMGSIQVRFALIFVLVAGLLLVATITIGSIFANRIAKPIRRLVKATELVQAGDLTVQINTMESKEDELSILTNAFNRMVKKIDIQQKDLALAQRAMAWSDVARRVAHEIKNPLTPITLSADRLIKKFLDQVDDKEGFTRYTSTIQRHTKDIQKIVTEFEDFAKMPTPNFEQCEIVSLLKELVQSRQVINDKIQYHYTHNVPILEFVCDITQINQVIVNLFKNAEEALETLTTEKKIYLDLELTDEDLELSISDNGKGFLPNMIDKVTEAYMTTRSKGSGLGLAIVKKIVHDHGGEILISNIKDGGGLVKLIFAKKFLDSKIKK